MSANAPELPPRFEAVARLGKGGGGEVWRVRDRVKKVTLALKLLAEDSGNSEVMALVREATTLSGLEGLGVPRVVAFGALADGRRYMVRELVEGQSYEDLLEADGADFLKPLAFAADVLTGLHRAGLLHGDVKPANIVVEPSGRATLVDLGLAAPWREGGTRPEGLTPRYAAPELFGGDPLTVRAEVFSLGATLRDGLEARGKSLDKNMLTALEKVAARATESLPESRYPSVDEFASALRSAAKLPPPRIDAERRAWPVLGIEAASHELRARVALAAAGDAIALEGAPKSGRSTLLRRLAWTLGVGGEAVALVDVPVDAEGTRVLTEEVLGAAKRGGLVVVDDLAPLPDAIKAELSKASRAGAKIVAAANAKELAPIVSGSTTPHPVPKLDDVAARDLVRRAIPSLGDAIVTEIVSRAAGSPGALRGMLAAVGTRAIVSVSELDELLSKPTSVAPSSKEDLTSALARSLETGRFDEAAQALASLEGALGANRSPNEAVDMALASAKIALARGDAATAEKTLESVRAQAAKGPSARAWNALVARVKNRLGDFTAAAEIAKGVVDGGANDAIASDALAVRGVALAYLGDDKEARAALERAVSVAEKLADKRAEAIAFGSLAIAHQRAGRNDEAKKAYERALVAAETAKDAGTTATMRLNLAGLAQGAGDLGDALVHLEAAVDMGRRAGARLAAQQALFNLANLDLYLGRYARAESSIKSLSEDRAALDKNARAQLLGLEAELHGRLGDIDKSTRLYALSAEMYEAVGRPLDAAEVKLESILTRARSDVSSKAPPDVPGLVREYDAVEKALGGGFKEHEAFALIVRGTLALLEGDETRARSALDKAYEEAKRAGRREWEWRALDSCARLATTQGAFALARKDTETALGILEETARRLPRDLREVFWNDPRRRALRTSLAQTVNSIPVTGGITLNETISQFARTGTTIAIGVSSEDRLARIMEVTRELANEHDMSRLLQKVTDHAVALASAERGLVLLANDDGELFAHTTRTAKGDEEHAKFSRSVAEEVVRSGEPVVVTSAKDDARVAKAVSVHALMIQSIACVPIRGAPPVGRAIGALYLETRLREAGRFKEELPILMAFANQAAIAIESARLIEENRARADELARANAELSSAHDRLEELLGRRTEQLAATRRDLKETRAKLKSHFGYGGLVGTSAPMRKLYGIIERIKDTDVPVLIIGESGTGKEVVAKAIHQSSARAKATFVGVNCGAIPENLLESELFGHARGAFTGADRERKGLFREAEGGSLLLDEIGELPLKMQAALLRVLQERKVRPVGEAFEVPVDTRIIAATNRDLGGMVQEGRFREDLLYRLQVVEIIVPPLRERKEDILPLVDHFLSIFSARYRRDKKSVEREARKRLMVYDWPGNVRQLEHVLLNAWLMSENDEITMEDFSLPDSESRPMSSRLTGRPPPSTATMRSEGEYRDAEKEKILAALTQTNWNRVRAAEIIGMPRRTFYRRLKEYGIL
jgi:transcriptional regulator with GAF, ATPase, and Fis domain/serine/threonine protein kinase